MKPTRRIVKTSTALQRAWVEYSKPFVVVPVAIWETDKLDLTDKVIIVSLFSKLANRKKPTAVSVSSISRDLDLGRHTVRQRMMWFEIAGWLHRTEDKTINGAVKYELNLVQLATWLSERGVVPRDQVPGLAGPGPDPRGPGGGPAGPPPIPSQIPDGVDPLPDRAGDGNTLSQGPGTGLAYPNKLGKVYKNKRPGFCTQCREDVGVGQGKCINFPEGAMLFCLSHIHDAEMRLKMTRINEGVRRIQ